MKNLLLLLTLSILGIAHAQKKPSFQLQPLGKAFIKLSYVDNPQNQPLLCSSFSNFPPRNNDFNCDSLMKGTGTKTIVLELKHPSKIPLIIGQYQSTFYLVPGDTLFVNINFNKKQGYSMETKSSLQAIQEYYVYTASKIGTDLNYWRGMAANDLYTLQEYSSKMDSLLTFEQSILKDYPLKNTLPDWFIDDEQKSVIYNDAELRVNTVLYRSHFNIGQKENPDANFLKFLTPSLLDNPSAIHQEKYLSLLNQVYYSKINNKVWQKDFSIFSWADSTFSKPVRDALFIYEINNTLETSPTGGQERLAQYYDSIADKNALEHLKTYYENYYKLKEGQIAPNFVLENQLDSLVNMKSFEGNVLFIGFWFTACRPCLAEIPNENALAKRFEGKNVKVISICVRSSKEDWMKASKFHQLNTLNSYANESWAASLIEKYNIRGFPHYVLIDKNRKVVQNGGNIRPNEVAAQQIEALLSKE